MATIVAVGSDIVGRINSEIRKAALDQTKTILENIKTWEELYVFVHCSYDKGGEAATKIANTYNPHSEEDGSSMGSGFFVTMIGSQTAVEAYLMTRHKHVSITCLKKFKKEFFESYKEIIQDDLESITQNNPSSAQTH